MAHTKGPWEIGDHENFLCVRQSDYMGEAADRFVCEVSRSNPQGYENARLISAAPDLLAACEAVDRAAAELIAADKTTNAGAAMAGAASMFRDCVRAAIAKARGQHAPTNRP